MLSADVGLNTGGTQHICGWFTSPQKVDTGSKMTTESGADQGLPIIDLKMMPVLFLTNLEGLPPDSVPPSQQQWSYYECDYTGGGGE